MEKLGIDEIHGILLDIMTYVDKFCRTNGIRYSLGGGTLLGAVRHKGFIPWDDDIDIMMPRPDYERFIAGFNLNNDSHYRCIMDTDDEHACFHQVYAKVHDIRTTSVETEEITHFKYGLNIDIFPIDGMPENPDTARKHIKQCRSAKHRLAMRQGPVFDGDHKLKRLFSHLRPVSHWMKKFDRLTKKYEYSTSSHAGAISGRYGMKEYHQKSIFEEYTDILFEGKTFRAIKDYDLYLTQHYDDYMQLPPENKRVTHSLEAYWKKGYEGNGLVGIISYNTHSNLLNYGAALHSFAFQQYLERHGIPSVIIRYISRNNENRNLKFPFFNLNRIGGGFNHHFNNFALGWRPHLKKYNKFNDFFLRHYTMTDTVYTSKTLLKTETIEGMNITTFVTESDVTWKSYYDGDFDPGFFLDFKAAEGRRKIAYAPSLSSKPYSEKDTERFLELTKDFESISCRESIGAEYLKKITGREVEWCLDPTLLLEAEDYEKIAVTPKESGYILLYNCMKNDRRMVRQAEAFAKSKGLQLIEVSNFYENRLKFNHKVITDAGIEEWLGYFKNADFVICNAFHGFCFSVIFRKQVLLFERDGSDFRMRSITEGLGAGDCMIPHDIHEIPEKYMKEDNQLPVTVDFERVIPALEERKRISQEFIEKYITGYHTTVPAIH